MFSHHLQYPAFDPAISACSDSLNIPESAITVSLHQSNVNMITPNVSQPINQNQLSAEPIHNPTGNWWETTNTNLSSLEPLLPKDNLFSAIQNFQSTPLDNSSFRENSIEGSTRSSCNASAVSSGSSISSETPHPSTDCGLRSNEKLNAADQFGTCEDRRPEPPPRRRKPRSPSSKHTEPLPCPSSGCPKSFVRRCELKLVSPVLILFHVQS